MTGTSGTVRGCTSLAHTRSSSGYKTAMVPPMSATSRTETPTTISQMGAAQCHGVQHADSLQAIPECGHRDLWNGYLALQSVVDDRRPALGISIGGDRTVECAGGPLRGGPPLPPGGLQHGQSGGVVQELAAA